TTFDGSKLASGAYFYRLKTGDYTATRKFLLMK
ncbi:MAG: T9SS type A sorting domain-containing protein, partial [Bacteroidota bacterium]|nr:T9SS type A sorting domain-containing protein [Bacteroidota bacterium]